MRVLLAWEKGPDLRLTRYVNVRVTVDGMGTHLRFAAAGALKLSTPWYVEALMAAQRFQNVWYGLVKETAQGVASPTQSLRRSNFALCSQARAKDKLRGTRH